MKRYIYKVLRKLNKWTEGLVENFYYFEQLNPKMDTPFDPAHQEQEIKKIKEAIARPLPTESELKRVDVIVLKYKDPEIEVQAAKRVIENTDWPYKLVMYDNRPGVKNFSKIWNQLIRESTCDYIIIMDSDVFVPKLDPCWLTRMMETMEKHDDCYAVLPRVTNTSSAEQKADKAEDRPAEPMKDIAAAMLALYKKDIFDKVGYFDEDFLFYAQDSEWSHRMMKKGYKTYLQHDVLVDHIGHYSTKKEAKSGEAVFDREIERQYAMKLYKEKTK